MLFNSITFVVFFTVVMLVHRLPLSWTHKKFNLLVASYVFYAAWNPAFVLLLGFSTLMDWYLAKGIARAVRPSARRFFLIISLTGNLGLLGFFKYGEFLERNLAAALALLGVEYRAPEWSIILPVGISFYTFQTLSYTLDVYSRRMQPWHSLLDYAMYVTFFPQLVAGPIVRAAEFLPQCDKPRAATRQALGWGLSLIVIGLFEKVVVADGLLAPVVDQVYGAAKPPDSLAAWGATLAFAGQIYCDFSGYSTCAIGVAMCLGFYLPENFRWPYGAIGFSDFWRRWHISLSSWLRDYLYIPLGGSRGSDKSHYANLMTTMLVGGLWHGASWTFVAWGALHGVLLVAETWLKRRWIGTQTIWQRPRTKALIGFLTFVAICFTWVLFRANSFSQAGVFFWAMLGADGYGTRIHLSSFDLSITVCIMGIICAIHAGLRDVRLAEAASRLEPWLYSTILAAMLVGIALVGSDDRAFIYFQF